VANICYISPISIHSTRYLNAFHQKGHKLSIITDSVAWVATPIPKSILYYRLPLLTRRNSARNYLPNLQKIARILREVNPDFVHIQAEYYYSPAVILSGKQFILTSWGTEVLNLPQENTALKALARITARKSFKVTVDASVLAEIWTQMGVSRSKVEVIPFGVDLNVFNPRVDGLEVRNRLNISEDEIVLISTRALHNHHYNVESFVRAMPLILKSKRGVKFIIKGSGPLEGYLQSLAKTLGVSEHVRFVKLVPHYEMANYLRAADIYVSTCFIDTTSVSLLEAMACGLAPIVTDIVGNREWIENGRNGFLFKPKDPKALADKAIQLIENRDLRRRFSEECSRLVKQKASWQECVSKMERLYQALHCRVRQSSKC
jgi:glycosyltransferase involved in cell wall biosynthesis